MIPKIFRAIIFLSLSVLLFSCGGKKIFTGKFGVEPVKPQPGDYIAIYYSVDSSTFTNAKEISMIAYPYSISADTVIEAKMMEEGGYWIAKINVPKKSRGIVFKFMSGELVDNNNGKGYVLFLNDENGKTLFGAKAGFAAAINGWGGAAEIKKNIGEVEKYFNEEFKINPEIKSEYLDSYLGFIYRKDKIAAKSEIKTELTKLLNKSNKSDDDFSLLYKWFTRIQEKEKADSIAETGLIKYPAGNFAKELRMDSFKNQLNLDKKIGIIKDFEKDFPGDDFVNNLFNSLLYDYARNALYDDAYSLITKNKNKISSVYFAYVAGKMLENKYDTDKVETIYKLGIEKSRADLGKDIDKEKSKTETKTEYLQNLNYYLARNLMGLGKLYFDQKETAKSMPLLKEGIEITEGFSSNPKMNEIYSKALLETGNYNEVLEVVGKFIDKGETTKELVEILKNAFVKKNGSDKGFEKYLAKFTNAAKKQMETDLEKKIKNTPAPKFTLLNLNGKKVSLADYHGKTVIIDFWATWCGPCKSSFPGMKKAVEFYKDNNNVKFLFINTWENVNDKKTNAKLFVTQNNYPFDVLLDTENKVVSDYMVSGIPTKFIIDKNGNIRFENVGFSGNTDQMVEEIKAMITMIQ